MQTKDHWAIGVAAAVAAHLIVGAFLACTYFALDSLRADEFWRSAADILGAVGLGWFFGLGLTQCLYLVPLALVLHFHKMPRALAGLLVSIGIVFLLSCACFSVFVFGGW